VIAGVQISCPNRGASVSNASVSAPRIADVTGKNQPVVGWCPIESSALRF
jgi:hypothetical protein